MADTQHPHEFLTVRELAELLRIKERKVYDLASSGQVPCSRATGKLLFPADQVRAWIERTKSGATAPARRPDIFLGSHDPLLDWALRESRSGFATMFDSSLDGLRRFAAGEGAAAGLHVREADGGWNVATAKASVASQDAVLVRWVSRTRGLVVRPDLKDKVTGPKQLEGLHVARRQPEAGAEVLFRHILSEHGVDEARLTATAPCRSEQDVVLAVQQGDADVAFGMEAVAQPYGLAFVPLIEERFDLLVDRRAWFEPPMQALMAFVRTEAFRDRAGRLAGYEVADLGQVVWNA